MSYFERNLKRRRISWLIRGCIVPGVLHDKTLSAFIKDFSDNLPEFFCKTGADGSVAGLILATLLEKEMLTYRQVEDSGYLYIRFIAETDSGLFEQKAPRIFGHLKSMEMMRSNTDYETLLRNSNA